MTPNRTPVWKVMTIWISREVSLFAFEHLDILCAWIGHPCEKLWPFEFLEGFCCSISSVTIYYDPESDIRVKSYDHFNFSRGFVIQFRVSRYIMSQNCTFKKIAPFEFLERFRCYTSSVSIYCAPESDIRVKSYDHLNFSRGSVVQFPASRYIMSPNRTSVWEDRTIWISRQLLLFYFERHDI